MKNFDNLFTDGYYVGYLNISDLDKFEHHVSIVKDCFENNIETTFHYRNQVKYHPELDMFVKMQDLEHRKNIIKENNYSVFQQWYESENCQELLPSLDYFRNIIKSFIRKLYPNLHDNFSNFKIFDSFTVYTDGDFLEPHIDGNSPGRLCVVLIYLSSAHEYNGTGDLIISNLSEKNEDNKLGMIGKIIKVQPIKGNFVILDFTKNNVNHAVEEVKGNFLRYTYIAFIYDSDIEKKNENL